MRRKSIFLLALCIIPFHYHLFAQNDGDEVTIGKYRVIDSKILGEQRRILVHLPEGYESSNLSYPVVYHLYGDFVLTYFAEAASVLERLSNSKAIPQVILIGVDNTDRYRDLRPVKLDGSPGGAEKFAQYFREELIPFVNSQYRTVDYRILAGVQAGACFGLYTLMEHPDLFHAYILDNSFDNPQIVDDYLLAKAVSFFVPGKTLNKFLFMKVDRGSSNLPLALRERTVIESNIPKGFRFEFQLNETEKNFMFESDFRDGCTKMFVGYGLPDNYNVEGLDDILKYYGDYSLKIGFSVNIPDRVFVETGDVLNRKRKFAETRRLWEYMLGVNPNSLDGLFQLGQLSITEGRYEDARELFMRFLTLRPQEAMIQNRLKHLEKMINESCVYEIEKGIRADGLKKGQQIYNSLKKDKQNNRYFDEAEFNALGYRFMNAGKINEAVAVFIMCTESFPQSANAWDSLGEAYLKKDDKILAGKSYEKSLELNPQNDNARKILEQLKK